MISAIVAVDENWGIGFNGQLLEHIPEDMKFFKKITTGNVVIMGRKTWESLPIKPLPDRLNLVVTSKGRGVDCMTAFIDMEEAKVRAAMARNDREDNWFVIGGGQIYEQLLPLCDRVYVTKIHKAYENVDTYFPNLDESDEWTPALQTAIQTHNDIAYQFWEYDRIS